MQRTFCLNIIAFSIFVFCFAGQASHAQAVRVKAAEEGQGFLFSEDGICYLLTAAHVTEGTRRAQVLTQNGSDGTATMMAPFWAGFDLDVGQVRRLEKADCAATFEDLLRGSASALAGARIVLPLVGPGGIDNLDLSVSRSDYLEFSGQFSDSSMAGKKGMSGAFALSGSLPVGMARAAADDGSIQFVQMAEITMNLRRWLDRTSVASSVARLTADETPLAGLPFEIISAVPPAIDSAHLIEAMTEGSAPFAYASGQDSVIVLKNMAEGQKVISRLRIESSPSDGYTQPQGVRIDITPREGTATAQFWRTDPFPPDGLYDTGPVARRFAAWIKITLIGARGNDPVRIDRIVLD